MDRIHRGEVTGTFFPGTDLDALLEAGTLVLDGRVVDAGVTLGPPGQTVSCRLVGVPAPDGTYRFYLTNLPRTVGPHSIADIYRVRWEIESDNKLDKSCSHLDQISARTVPATRALIHASIVSSMLACLIVHKHRLGEPAPPAKKPKRAMPDNTREPSLPTKNAEPTQPAKNAEPTPPTKNAEPTQPAKNAEPTPPAKNADHTKPAKNAEPTKPAKNAERTTPPLHPQSLARAMGATALRIAETLALDPNEATAKWQQIADYLFHLGHDPNWRSRPSVLDQMRGWRISPGRPRQAKISESTRKRSN